MRLVDGNTAGTLVVPPQSGARSWFSGEHVLTLRDGTLTAPDLPDGEAVVTLRVPGDTRYASAGPGLNRFVIAGQRGATVFSRDGLALAVLDHPATVNRAAFSPDGQLIATAGSDGDAIVWEATADASARSTARRAGLRRRVRPPLENARRRLERRRRAGLGPLSHAKRRCSRSTATRCGAPASATTRHLVLTASRDSTARTWKVETRARRGLSSRGTKVRSRPGFSCNPGDRLATGGDDGTVRTWVTQLQPFLRPAPGMPPPESTRDPRATIDGEVVRLDNGVTLRGHRDDVLSV